MISNPDSVILSISSYELNKDEIEFFKDVKPFGFVLFRRNFENKKQLIYLINSLKQITQNKNLLIFIDQEGGKVQRLNNHEFIKFPPQKVFGDMYKKDFKLALDLAYKSSYLMGYQQKSVGIDVDFSPVCDLYFKNANNIIGSRSFSHDPAIVLELSRIFCKGLFDSGIIPVPKHFPGHGRSLEDTHLKKSKINISFDELYETDMVPFKILDDSLMVMLAHIIYPKIDNHVATYSKKIISMMRNKFNFDGLVLSDDISMKALSGSRIDRVKKSYEAGCNIILYCKGDLKEIKEIYPYIRKIDNKYFEIFVTKTTKLFQKKKNFTKFKTDLIKYKLIKN